ncbi:MAG: MFS transporter [Thermodesulfobacteriota bacterium]
METQSQSLEYYSEEQPAPFTSLRDGFWVLFVAIIGTGMSFIDSTGINTILPILQHELGAKITQAQWVIESYALFVSSLILFGGALGDKFGRKKIFIIGLILFALCSLWCGLAPTTNNLILARAFQGVGGALLIPASLALLTVSFDTQTRSRAFGIWSASVAATTALGPIIGGWLAVNLSWRYVFFINIPVALIVLPALLFKVRHDGDLRPIKLDLVGSLLISSALGFFVFGLIESPNMGYADIRVIGSLALGLILDAVFIFYEKKLKEPLVPMKLFQSKTFTGANIVSFLFWFAWNAVIFYIPFSFIQLHGYSPLEFAISFIPGFIALLILAPLAGELISRFGVRILLMLGIFIVSASFYLFSLTSMNTEYTSDWLLPILLMGAGVGLSSSPMVSAVVGSQDKKYSGLVSGINNAVGRIAGLLGIAIIGLIGINVFNFTLDKHLINIALDPEALELLKSERIKFTAATIPEWLDAETIRALNISIKSSFHTTFVFVMKICAAICFIGGVVTYFLIDDSKIELE